MEIIQGPTPNGGAYAHIYYLDDKGKTSSREKASNGHILEFDEKGNRIYETHFMINDKPVQTNNNLNTEKIEVFNIDEIFNI